MAPDLASLSSSDAKAYEYFDATSAASYASAVEQLHAYVTDEGPFDGLLAFSQGASLAAMYLVHQSLQQSDDGLPIKVAILISSAAIYDPVAWLEQGQVRVLNCASDGQPIKIPTAHIWGAKDELRTESEALSDLTDEKLKALYVHTGGHEVPGLSTQGAVQGTVQAVRRAIIMAMLNNDS
ncbi:MAG: hypothetical protein Q9226_008123 [Calogaya cf. arnoldii]